MKAKLALALHFHQPIGNFEKIFKRAYENCYKPFIDILKSYPKIAINLHFSGCLLEWIEKNAPEFLLEIKGLAEREQAEIMSGGFYEPILPVIPERDRLSQIEMLNKYIGSYFAFEPEGAWIAERVWEPGLPVTLSNAGLKYAILDDTHFIYAGLKKRNTYGYYITEDEGKGLALFSSDKTLRYSIPFKPHNESIEYMKDIAQEVNMPLFVYGDDGEKFGEWPGTHNWVYRDKWLVSFFDALLKNRYWLETVKFSDVIKNDEPLGRIYIPTASYDEMLEWALPVEAQEEFEDMLGALEKERERYNFYKPFLKGGFWRNFLVKYPEANHMHKKMLFVSDKLHSLEQKMSSSDADDKRHPLLNEAKRELYKGQCNCAYWHGVFGGLYLYHLRSAVYKNLIKAETLINKLLHPKGDWLSIERKDFDSDSQDEVIIENSQIFLCVDFHKGGSLIELDIRGDKCVNIMNTLTRRKEAYHRALFTKAKSPDSTATEAVHKRQFSNIDFFKNRIFYDKYRRASLIDHFLSDDTDIDSFSICNYNELGDFAEGAYDILDLADKVSLRRKGSVDTKPVAVAKTIIPSGSSGDFKVHYSIKNNHSNKQSFWFGVECNFSLTKEKPKHVFAGSDSITLKDDIENLSVNISLSKKGDIWRFPIKTISQSERNIEENYQATSYLFNWKFSLKPEEIWELTISFKF